MVNYSIDKFIGIANQNKQNYGLNDEYISLYPMFRMVDDKLFVVVPFVKFDEKVWNKESKIIPTYWALIDPITKELIEFNKTSENSFINGDIKENNSDDIINQEISKLIVNKKLEYKKYIKDDIKENSVLSFQKKVIQKLNNVIKIDNYDVSINDYIFANIEENLNEEIDKLLDLVASSKYNSIILYYDILFNNIIDEYIKIKRIDSDKIILACEIISSYYIGITGLENLFNII